MNIFYLDRDIEKAAMYHNNKHVVKMIIETAQLLCSAHWANGNEAPYKMSHKNNPFSIWVGQSLSNYMFLCHFGLELGKEYTYRYGKIHKSISIIQWCLENIPNIPDMGFTDPPKAMPDKYKVDDVVESYRNYYIGDKSGFANWKNRNAPKWYFKNNI